MEHSRNWVRNMTPRKMIIIGSIMLLAPIWWFVLLLLGGASWKKFIYNYEWFGSYFSEFRNIFPSECEDALDQMKSSSQLLRLFCDIHDTVAEKPILTVIYAVAFVGALVLLFGLMKFIAQEHGK